MRILGIDPGLATVGFGIIDAHRGAMQAVSYGVIRTPANTPFGERLQTLYENMDTLIKAHQPDTCGIESVFFTKNVTTGIQVSHARGVVVLALAQHNIPMSDYTPTMVKSSISGHGGAEKRQVQFMTKELLQLTAIPKPDDVADALAIAICHHHSLKSMA